MKAVLLALVLAGASTLARGQALDTSQIANPTQGTWPTYNGDYSGRRYSPLKLINRQTVNTLTLSWVYSIGGDTQAPIKATPLEVNGILYFTMPDYVWAIDAKTGREIWHYQWQSKGGIHIGNRGVGIYRNALFFETPDDHLVCLDKDTGKLRWDIEIADLALEYFATAPPLVIGNHVIVGIGGDSLDVPGFLEALDPDTGALQWKFSVDAMPGDPGFKTWPNAEAAAHGGGGSWLSGTYDPELNLYYFGSGNPNPVYASQSRQGDNLYTASIIALNPDTGKMAWYFQASPHDTHDWDDVETPVLIDAEVQGHPRKLLAQAARNGYFFVIDRTNGKNILSKPFVTLNWSMGTNAGGNPIANPAKIPSTDGVLVAPAIAAANWPAPSFDPLTGLFYVNAYEGYQIWYLTDTSAKPEGYAGSTTLLWSKPVLKAIDIKTGKVKWKHPYETQSFMGMSGVLTTAGDLLFAGDGTGHLIAFDPETGAILWHARLGAIVSNGPMTYELDGKQYIVVGAADRLYAFTLSQEAD